MLIRAVNTLGKSFFFFFFSSVHTNAKKEVVIPDLESAAALNEMNLRPLAMKLLEKHHCNTGHQRADVERVC